MTTVGQRGRRAVGRRDAGRLLTLSLLPLSLAAALPAQSDRRCLLALEHADHSAHTRVTDEIRNDYFGGNVRYRCRGQNVRMWTDSVASYQGQVVYFVGNFRFEDEQSHVTSDFGTYYKDNERWEARGNVVYTDKLDGSTLRGPMVDYFRGISGPSSPWRCATRWAGPRHRTSWSRTGFGCGAITRCGRADASPSTAPTWPAEATRWRSTRVSAGAAS
jgi:hypothetical protein